MNENGRQDDAASPNLPEERIGPGTAYWYERHLFVYRLVSNTFRTTDAVVVDLGCGEAYGLSEMQVGDRLVVGIDRHIETLVAKKGEGRVLLGGDVIHVPLKDDSVDALVSFQVIEHLNDADSFLSEVKRVLRPEGRFYLTTPNARRSDRGIEFRSPWHVHEYMWSELESLLGTYFASVRVRGIDLRAGSTIARSDRAVSTGERLDPFRLRRFVPKSARSMVLRLLGYFPPPEAGVAIQDFVAADQETSRTVDLWAECRLTA